MLFEDFGLAPQVLRAVVSKGYVAPTPVQQEAIPHVMAGRDVLACAQTGTGKTAGFALPVLHRLLGSNHRQGKRPIRTLVLSPTRELALQISASFNDYGQGSGLRFGVIYGGVDQRRQVRSLQQGIDVLVATPGRLCDLMNQGHVDLSHVKILVLDEADRMLDMGFLPDLRRIIGSVPKQRQTVLFSATMPSSILELAHSIMINPVSIDVTPDHPTTELVEQFVYLVARQQKPQKLANLLREEDVTRAIVFTRTKHGADRVVRQLGQSGIRAEAIHGNKSQAARQRTLLNFRTNQVAVLVATDLAARGIDVHEVSHVLNYDMPDQPETYVHRIGRTARAGAAGIAISLCDSDERKHLRSIERLIRKKLIVEGGYGEDERMSEPAAKPVAAGSQARRGNWSRRGSNKRRFPHRSAL